MNVEIQDYLNFSLDEGTIKFPRKLLFSDYSCAKPFKIIDLRGWILSEGVFPCLATENDALYILILDHSQGWNLHDFQSLRGHPSLKRLSLAKAPCKIDRNFAEMLGSFPSLLHLNLSNNKLESGVCNALSTTCKSLRSINLSKCSIVDNYSLHALASCIGRFRSLEKIDLSYCSEFTDEGLLELVQVGFNILVELNISYCKQLTTLCFAGLRNKMSQLTTLYANNMNVGLTTFEWISEGCKNLIFLNLTRSQELYDENLIKIGRWCKFLKTLLLIHCSKITDVGIAGFFSSFLGQLDKLDISGCLQCGEDSVISVAQSPTVHSILDFRLNGLSKVSTRSLLMLFNLAPVLRHFELCCELRSSSSHRKSMMPHLSDVVLTQAAFTQLEVVKIVGSFQVSDAGVISMVKKCSSKLRHLDLSYCSNISDLSLEAMSEHLTILHTLILNGCVYISNRGLLAFSRGKYTNNLKHFEANGCMKITDVGFTALSKFYNLETLSIRSCDYITDKSIIVIANSCAKLQNLDIQGLDLVSITSLQALLQNCIHLTSLNFTDCNVTPKEFNHLLKKSKSPFIQPISNKCFSEKRTEACIQHNRFVLTVQKANNASKVIQKFMKATKTAKLVFIAKQLQKKHRNDLRRIFNAFRQCVHRNSKLERREGKMDAVRTIQRILPQLYSIYCARSKLKRLRKENNARRLIQRCYRGYACRKRCKKKFTRLFYFYTVLGRIFYKYMLMGPIYALRRRHIKLQAFARMIPKRVSFLAIRYFICSLQRKFRLFKRFKYRRSIIDHQRATLAKIEYERRDKAARFIQKNWKNRIFNSMMAPFIFFCSIYHRNEYDEQLWSAIKIQKVFRGHNIRLKKYKASIRFQVETAAAIRVQTLWRCHFVHSTNKSKLQHHHELQEKYRRMWVRGRPRIRLGRFARIIQRSYKLYLFRLQRHNAATILQRRYRRYFIRIKWEKLIVQIRYHSAAVIQRAAHTFVCRVRRRDMKNRQHMAAYRIYLAVDKFFEIQRVINKRREEERLQREQVNQLKRQKLFEKRTLIVEKIILQYHNALARRIQKAFRTYVKAKEAAMRQDSQSVRSAGEDSLTEASSLAQPSLTAKVAATVMQPIRVAKDSLSKAAKLFASTELIPKKEEKKFANAVLKYQLKSILQEGVVDIHITVGETETKSFEAMQFNRKNQDLPFFVKVPHDLSGTLGLNMFFWIMFGTGVDVICELLVQPRPPNTSNAAMKIREQVLDTEQHTKLAWHPNIHFEIQGIRSVKQGKADFALRDVILTSDPEEEEVLLGKEYKCIIDFNDLGFSHLTMWTNSRKLEDEDVLFKFSRLTANHWCDERLIRTVKAFNLSEEDVSKMRRTFDDMLMGRNRETLRNEDLFSFVDFPYNNIARWSVMAIKPARKSELKFSEYVHYISYFVMLSAKDLTKFLFQHADVETNYYLRREQFNALLEILSEGSPFNVKAWEYQYEQYHDKKLKFQFIKNFEDFVNQNPGALWQPQLLQQKLMKANIGKTYWDNKIEQYRVMRVKMDIKLR